MDSGVRAEEQELANVGVIENVEQVGRVLRF
jgi:hypothetical protein